MSLKRLAAALVVAVSFSTNSCGWNVSAHDFWENGEPVDPATKIKCCGKNDCYTFYPPKYDETTGKLIYGWPEPERVDGGYTMIDRSGKKRFIADKHVQPSPDGFFHACEWGSTGYVPEGYRDEDAEGNGAGIVKCFFAPMTM